MAFEIEKGIPKPKRDSATQPSKYPWREMETGDSFFVADARPATISEIAFLAGERLGRKFSMRSVKDDAGNLLGVRVWRDK